LNPLIEKIAAEIRNSGPISFARFMELALYCPVYGYYEKEGDTPGRRGDYFTSVSVGPLFGELLALRFAEWLDGLENGRSPGFRPLDPPRVGASDDPLALGSRKTLQSPEAAPGRQIVEAGAHDGRLAKDILHWLQVNRADTFQKIAYWIVEPSQIRQQWQRRALGDFAAKVRWVCGLGELRSAIQHSLGLPPGATALTGVRGVIFSNELLDAMPTHRFSWDAATAKWFEWGVDSDVVGFRWTRLGPARGGDETSAHAPNWPAPILRHLPDGFTTETCPAANRWWAEAAAVLEAGHLMTIDYGLTEEEYFAPERFDGTLRAYRRHQVAANVLADPGDQDLTAHVNFSALSQAGEAAGLRTELLSNQEEFLMEIAAPIFRGERSIGEWTKERTAQFQTLTHPAHLGRVFRALVQSRRQDML
jgi:SAM-dependent MidA family methyltransferase